MDPVQMTAPTDFTPTLVPETAVSDHTLETNQLLGGTYVRTGMDLTISHPGSETVTIPDYFDTPLALSNGDGLVLTPDMVTGLAHAGTPLTVAQAGEADAGVIIGQIEEAQGSVTVQRLGEELSLGVGDNVWLGDMVSTDEGGAVGLRLADETQFTIAGNSRMILDEFVYDPGAGVGNVSISVVQGAFSFISGQASGFGPDAMQVNTPVGTIGIRGTQVIGELDIAGQTITIVLIPEADGSVGQIAFQNAAGEVILSAPFEAITNASVTQLPTPIQFENLAAVSAFLGSSFETLDNFTQPRSLDPTDPENGTETTNGTEDDTDTTSSDDNDEDEETEGEDDEETTSEDEPSPDDVTNDIANQIIAALNTTPTEDTAPEVPTTTTTPDTNAIGGQDTTDPTTTDDDDNSDEDARLLALQALLLSGEGGTDEAGRIIVTSDDATTSIIDGDIVFTFTDASERFEPAVGSAVANALTVGPEDEYYTSNEVRMEGGDDFFDFAGGGQIYGGSGNDTLFGGQGAELYGGDGNDVLFIPEFGYLYGGNGDDTLVAPSGASIPEMDGGAGTDTADYTNNSNDLSLGNHNVSNIEVLLLGAGNDTVNGTETDTIFGGSGDDYFQVESNSTLFGGSGGDSFKLSDEHASGISISGGSGTDTLLIDVSGSTINFNNFGNFDNISSIENIHITSGSSAQFANNLLESISDTNSIVITSSGTGETVFLEGPDFSDVGDDPTADADANALIGSSSLDFNQWSNGTVTLYIQDNLTVQPLVAME